jgi:hypothetical protein
MKFDYEVAAEAMIAYGRKMQEALEEKDMDKYKKAVLSALRCCHTTLVYLDDNSNSE